MSWQLLPATAFAQWRGPWEALRAAGPAAPILHADFVAALLAEFAAGGELLAISCEGGAPQAMLLLERSRAGWQSFQPAQAPLGVWVAAPGFDLPAALPALLRRLPGFPLLLALTQADPLLTAAPAGAALRCLPYIDTARISVDGSFEVYWEGRGKNLRSNLHKQRNRLQREGVVTRLQVSTDAAEVAAAVADYARLETASWKGRAGSAVGAGDAQGRFYARMLAAFCARGAGRIYRYWFGEQLVAMDLCIVDGDCLVVLKTAYDESVAAGLSPALLMREECCRQLFATAGLRRIEFYGRVMEWHRRWSEEVRTLYHLNAYRWPWLAGLHQWWRARATAD